METNSDPKIVCLCSALAMMLFSGDFRSCVAGKDWGHAAAFIVVTWFGFLFFWAISKAASDTAKKLLLQRCKRFLNTPKKETCFTRLIEYGITFLTFAVMYYIGHYII